MASDERQQSILETCLALESYRVPEFMAFSAWHEHAPFAFWLIKAQRPQVLVELGTHYGFSYMTFCEAVKRAEVEARCYAVDTWRGDEHAGFYGDEVLANLRHTHNPWYGGFSRLIRTTFDDAVNEFPDASIDLLHIDGRHGYADVKHDFETWRPKLSNRSIVLFHDTEERDRGFGVFQLWQELKREYRHFEFAHGHGLGVLGFGRSATKGTRALFAATADPEMSRAIRTIYARLGGAIADRWALMAATVKVHALEARLSASEIPVRNPLGAKVVG